MSKTIVLTDSMYEILKHVQNKMPKNNTGKKQSMSKVISFIHSHSMKNLKELDMWFFDKDK